MESVERVRGLLGGTPDRASQPFPTPLGTLDAFHLATALLRKESGVPDLVMATHDGSLAVAARASGLSVLGSST